jgi:hypothetical protein
VVDSGSHDDVALRRENDHERQRSPTERRITPPALGDFRIP